MSDLLSMTMETNFDRLLFQMRQEIESARRTKNATRFAFARMYALDILDADPACEEALSVAKEAVDSQEGKR